jgi:hypothetical protein
LPSSRFTNVQISAELVYRRDKGQTHTMLGKAVMKLGIEFDQSYIQALIVLGDGSVVSGAENGNTFIMNNKIIHLPHDAF